MKFNASRRETGEMTTARVGLAAGSGSLTRRAPSTPSDGCPLPTTLKLRQHEVQVVSGPGGCLAAAWTDDTKLEGIDGWTCGYSVSLDGGRSWSTSRFHKRLDFAATGNPTIAVDTRGVVFAVSMSVQADYSSGVLELAHSTDAGRNWSPWRVIASKPNGIPDRPKLAVGSNGDLHLVFSNVERTGQKLRAFKSTIQAMRSTDRGQTWSEPRTISLGEHRSRWFIDGHQGPAIFTAPNSVLLVSWADYYGNCVHFSSSENSGADFKPPVPVRMRALAGKGVITRLLGLTFGTPATGLAMDVTGRNIVISVHEAHAMGKVLLVGTQNGGQNWSRLAQLSRCGTNASLSFDLKGRLHALWTELCSQRVDTRYAVSSDSGRSFAPSVSLAGGGALVALPRSDAEQEECKVALGSYQSLVIDEADRAFTAWIDLRTGLPAPRLFHSAWKL
jgi:hypothetical protein